MVWLPSMWSRVISWPNAAMSMALAMPGCCTSRSLPILWPMCSLPLTRPISIRNLVLPLPSSNCMNTSRATSPSSVCLPASMPQKCYPLGQTGSAFLSVPSVPPRGGGMSMERRHFLYKHTALFKFYFFKVAELHLY